MLIFVIDGTHISRMYAIRDKRINDDDINTDNINNNGHVNMIYCWAIEQFSQNWLIVAHA